MVVFNAHQQVFQLSLMSFTASEINGTQAQLQKCLEERLPVLLGRLRESGTWEIVWGPTVWKHNPDDDTTGPDHVFYVVRNRNLTFPNGEQKDTYVLAIAGSQTDYNYEVNNFVVDKIVDLHKWLKRGLTTPPEIEISPSPENCYISLGTALGLYRLASTPPPSTAASPGIEMASYWASFPESPDTKVIVTGHSLGGPFSSTYALALSESGAFAKFTPSNVLVYPTAGPAVGNIVFSKLYSDRFPVVDGPSYQVWNCMMINLRDPIGQAWSTSKTQSPMQNMTNIPTIYGKPLPEVLQGVARGTALANVSGIDYFPIPARWFEGDPPESQPTNVEEFMKAVWWQHSEELLKLMGMEEIVIEEITDELLRGQEGLQRMSNSEKARAQPFMHEMMAQLDIQNAKDEKTPEACKQLQALSGKLVK